MEQENIKIAKELKEKIEKLTLEFKVSSNQGKVFGSISSKQICEELEKNEIKINKKMIMAENLNTLGMHEVSIQLHKKVVAKLKVQLTQK